MEIPKSVDISTFFDEYAKFIDMVRYPNIKSNMIHRGLYGNKYLDITSLEQTLEKNKQSLSYDEFQTFINNKYLENKEYQTFLSKKYNIHKTPLSLATHNKIIKLLIKYEANVNYTGNMLGTPLLCAVGKKDRKMVKILLNSGADPNIKNMDGLTPLTSAVLGKNIKIIKLLLYYNKSDLKNLYKSELLPDLNIMTENGYRAIDHASGYSGNLKTVLLLLDYNHRLDEYSYNNLSLKDKSYLLPIKDAILYKRNNILDILLKNEDVIIKEKSNSINEYYRHISHHDENQKKIEIKENEFLELLSMINLM